MRLQLQNVDFSDGDELAAVQITSNSENQMLEAFNPGLDYETKLAAAKERWPSIYGFGPFYVQKVVDADTGKVVSVGRWMMPPKYKEDLPALTGIPDNFEIPPRKPPTTLDREIVGQFGQQSDAFMQSELGERDVIGLDMMGTLPEFRGQGAASLMLEWAAGFADKYGIPCYCEALRENIKLLAKYGFEQRGTIKLDPRDGSVLTVAFTVREPKATTAS